MDADDDQRGDDDLRDKKAKASRKALKSGRRRRHRHEKRESYLNFNFDMPGVLRIILSEKTQKDMGCLVGEDVTSEKPWKFIKKEMFEDHMEMNEASEFLSIRLDLITYPKLEILIGYAPDETRDYDEFYVVLAETAEEKIKEVIQKIREEQEHKLARAINKKVRRWRTLGSEAEIEEYTEKSNRPLIEVEMEAAYPIMSPKITFKLRPVEAARDGYAELLSDRLEITTIPKRRIHVGVQVAPSVLTAEAQTVCSYPKNVWTQYHYEFMPVETLTPEFEANIKEYLENQLDWLCDNIRVNHAINLYMNDYEMLITDEVFTKSPQTVIWDECMSFADLNEARNKMIASVCWHPIWTGTVVISYADYAPNIYRRYKSTADEYRMSRGKKMIELALKLQLKDASDSSDKVVSSVCGNGTLVEDHSSGYSTAQGMSPLQNNIFEPLADPDEYDISSLPVIIIDEQGNPIELTNIGEENGSNLLVDNAPATTEISENNPQLLDQQPPTGNNTDDIDISQHLSDESQLVEQTNRMKRKSRKACTDSWTATEERRKREQGKTYLGRKQNAEGDWTYDVKRSNRIMKVRSSCKLSRKNKGLMCSSVTEEQRKQIFTDFWALSWKEKRVYIQTLCVFKQVQRARDRKEAEKSRRSFSMEYYLKVGGDRVNNIIHGVNPVLIWCFNDGLHPKLFLESHRRVDVVSFCPFNENLIVGGLSNGQVVIWDIKNKLNKVEEEEILTTAQQKYRVLMFSLMDWMKNTRDFSRVRITAESDVQYSHSSPITSIKWMTPTWKLNKTGQLEEIHEGDPYSLQFVTSSADGSILFWDLLAKPATNVGDYKPHRKSRRLKVRPAALTMDVSPFRMLNRLLRPHYRLVTHNTKKNKPFLLSCTELLPVHVSYTAPSAVLRNNLNERAVCQPIIEKAPYPPRPELVCSSIDGYFARVKWEGYYVNPGEVVNQETVKIVNVGRYHDGPVTCIDRNRLLPDTYLTVGGKVFAIWHDSYKHRPIIWRKSRHRYLHGAWNLINPAMLRLCRSDGNREVWYLIKRTDRMFYEQSLSGNLVLGSYTHPSRGNSVGVLGVADYNGTFRIFYVPAILCDTLDVMTTFRNQVNREVQRKMAFTEWQTNWLEKNQNIVQERCAKRIEFQRKREEKALREQQRLSEEKQRIEREQKLAAQKSVPQPGQYMEWAEEQWRIKEEERMNKVLLLKKQLNPDLLVSQQMPLKILQQEEEKKKKKQKERLQKSEKIFTETVAMLFPDVIKKKPPPPLDPYAGGDPLDEKRLCLAEYAVISDECNAYVTENSFVYNFDWKTVMQGGRERRRAVDNQFLTFSHKDRHENEKKLRTDKFGEDYNRSRIEIPEVIDNGEEGEPATDL
ncbi:dynein intermediate chain [Holotrichia oblita]|uniref:Dynein intermediate chain n=1 Tax=Holotrichia oblita TaxID=644536 RepID=A0ACB9SYV2_HOLOL|nr:dynein intermediate chain [Holotrichia oblita]